MILKIEPTNPRELVLRTETSDDQFLLGKLTALLKNAHVFPREGGQRETTVNIDELLKLAAGGNR